MAEFNACILFSVCHFRSDDRVTFYVENTKALYVNKWRRRGTVPVSVEVKALWAPESPPRSPFLITHSNHWSTDANRVVFKLFGKKVVEFTIEMHMNCFFDCTRTGYCYNTAFSVPRCLCTWCPTCSPCCYCHPPWQQLNAEAGASPAHWKVCSHGAQKNSCTERNYFCLSTEHGFFWGKKSCSNTKKWPWSVSGQGCHWTSAKLSS